MTLEAARGLGNGCKLFTQSVFCFSIGSGLLQNHIVSFLRFDESGEDLLEDSRVVVEAVFPKKGKHTVKIPLEMVSKERFPD